MSYFISMRTAFAEEILTIENNNVGNIIFVEQESADCSLSDGKLILIQNIDATQTYQVWIDRWFMNVQTPDHTKQILPPRTEPSPLGCSIARSGGEQHWTIYSVDAIAR